MEIICLEENAFYVLVEQVVERVKLKNGVTENRWLSADQAMDFLKITSKTTLQKLRDNGSIKFTTPAKKWILYDRDSLNDYLEKHAKNTF
jgi:Helix-turn-helix domain